MRNKLVQLKDIQETLALAGIDLEEQLKAAHAKVTQDIESLNAHLEESKRRHEVTYNSQMSIIRSAQDVIAQSETVHSAIAAKVSEDTIIRKQQLSKLGKLVSV